MALDGNSRPVLRINNTNFVYGPTDKTVIFVAGTARSRRSCRRRPSDNKSRDVSAQFIVDQRSLIGQIRVFLGGLAVVNYDNNAKTVTPQYHRRRRFAEIPFVAVAFVVYGKLLPSSRLTQYRYRG